MMIKFTTLKLLILISENNHIIVENSLTSILA